MPEAKTSPILAWSRPLAPDGQTLINGRSVARYQPAGQRQDEAGKPLSAAWRVLSRPEENQIHVEMDHYERSYCRWGRVCVLSDSDGNLRLANVIGNKREQQAWRNRYNKEKRLCPH